MPVTDCLPEKQQSSTPKPTMSELQTTPETIPVHPYLGNVRSKAALVLAEAQRAVAEAQRELEEHEAALIHIGELQAALPGKRLHLAQIQTDVERIGRTALSDGLRLAAQGRAVGEADWLKPLRNSIAILLILDHKEEFFRHAWAQLGLPQETQLKELVTKHGSWLDKLKQTLGK